MQHYDTQVAVLASCRWTGQHTKQCDFLQKNILRLIYPSHSVFHPLNCVLSSIAKRIALTLSLHSPYRNATEIGANYQHTCRARSINPRGSFLPTFEWSNRALVVYKVQTVHINAGSVEAATPHHALSSVCVFVYVCVCVCVCMCTCACVYLLVRALFSNKCKWALCFLLFAWNRRSGKT